MATGGVQVTGLNAVVRELQALGVTVDDLKGAFSTIADEGASLAAGFAPKRSGRLAASIRGNRAKNKAVVVAGGRAAQYAGPINYGWPRRNIAASGFMQRADAALQPRVLGRLETEIDNAIRRSGLT